MHYYQLCASLPVNTLQHCYNSHKHSNWRAPSNASTHLSAQLGAEEGRPLFDEYVTKLKQKAEKRALDGELTGSDDDGHRKHKDKKKGLSRK